MLMYTVAVVLVEWVECRCLFGLLHLVADDVHCQPCRPLCL